MTVQFDPHSLPPDVQQAVMSGRAKLQFSKQRVRCGCGSGLTGEELNAHLNSGCTNKILFGPKETADLVL